MQFRDWMFGPDSNRFVNLGGLVQSLDDLELVATSAPAGSLPRFLLIGVDARWLNGNSRDPDKLSLATQSPLTWEDYVRATRAYVARPRVVAKAVRLLFAGKQAIGIRALVDSSGFRRDGSFRWSYSVPDSDFRYVDRVTPTALERIRIGTLGFERTSGVDRARLHQLGRVLDVFTRRGVIVAGFIPPLAGPVVAALEADDRQRPLLMQFGPSVAATFAARGLSFVDASRLEQFGLDDRYMGDGYHAMETFHVVLLTRLLQDPKVQLALQVRPEWLTSLLRDPRTNYWYVAGH
ncbi:MAG: hypothetical protein JWO05_1294 [Gemmatimonadetes bacterium]|nr:hypothetical protein [Gemmatimonadota bacterium]